MAKADEIISSTDDEFFALARLKQEAGMSDAEARETLRQHGFDTGSLIDPRVDCHDARRSVGFVR